MLQPPGWVERLSRRRYFDASLIVLLMVLSLALRWRALWASYWGDEAIAVGIAVHPLTSLPHYLANDGSPPLYYLMLHFWMRMFGQSEPATHALSMVPALLAVPAAWWSGEKLFGRWAARAAAALVATCAYLDYYANETRMYSWLVLSATLALACFALAYQGAGRRYWAGAVFFMATTLYLQYYGLYLLTAAVVVGGTVALTTRSWPRLRATVLYGAACAVTFAPWAPQFLYQLHHTGAPWAPHPSLGDLFGDSFNSLASAGWAGVVLALVVAVLATWRPFRRRGKRWEPTVLAVATAVPVLTVLIAWLIGQVVNSWDPRYLGIAMVPALVPLAGGLARARRGRLLALAVATAALAATAVPFLVDRNVTVRTSKSDVAYLLGQLKGRLHPGALVISTQVADTPVIALDLGKGYLYANAFGRLSDPLVVNWANLPTRLLGINATADLLPLIKAVPAGGQVLLVNPTSWGAAGTPERYSESAEAEGIAANQAVVNDAQLLREVTEPVPRYSDPLYPMTATLYEKVRTAG
jgi:hypothetical protein